MGVRYLYEEEPSGGGDDEVEDDMMEVFGNKVLGLDSWGWK